MKQKMMRASNVFDLMRLVTLVDAASLVLDKACESHPIDNAGYVVPTSISNKVTSLNEKMQ
jgi:hypothetical protein